MAVLESYKYLDIKQVPLSWLRQLASGLCCCLDFPLSIEKGINMLPGNIISKVNFKKKKQAQQASRSPGICRGRHSQSPASGRECACAWRGAMDRHI